MRIGAHVPADDPLTAAAARGAELVQVFLSPPQSYRAPDPRTDAEALRSSDLPIYVHAPYVMNLASTNPRIRHPARKTLQQTLTAAGAVGAAGVIVHGGHLPVDDDIDEGFTNWRKAMDRLETDVPVLIENTAGGDNAVSRHVDRIARLFDALDGTGTPYGLCLDTCHAHAAGEDLATVAERLLAAVGRIDLVHLNDSRDDAGSGADRHTNLGHGRIDPDLLVHVTRVAGADVVLETPGDVEDHVADLAWIRARLS